MHTLTTYAFSIAADDDGEPRVFDLDVAEALGFERPRDIRKIIERNRLEMERYGSLRRDGANPGPRGGRPAFEYHLNEGQALLIATFSRTIRAADVREALIRVFMDWRAGKTVPVRAHNRRPPAREVEAVPSRFPDWRAMRRDGDPRDVRLRQDPDRAHAAYARRLEQIKGADMETLARLLAWGLARLDDIAPDPKSYAAWDYDYV